MADDVKVTCQSNNGVGLGTAWFMGWLFTIGFLKLAFWKAALALIVWPYYLGVTFSTWR